MVSGTWRPLRPRWVPLRGGGGWGRVASEFRPTAVSVLGGGWVANPHESILEVGEGWKPLRGVWGPLGEGRVSAVFARN